MISNTYIDIQTTFMLSWVVNYRPRSSRNHYSALPLLPSPVFSYSYKLPASPSSKKASLFSSVYKLSSSQLLSFDILTNARGACFVPTIQYSQSTIPFLFKLLRTLLHIEKSYPFSFQAIPHSFHKTPGGRAGLMGYRPGASLTDWTGSIPDIVS